MNFARYILPMLAACTALPAPAQDYPVKPIRLVVPFGPGGTTDILARVIGDRLTERWGQQVLIDNRPGAGGNIAAEMTSRAAPDGYTLFLGSMGTQSMNISIYSKLAFDPVKDFAPISLVSNSANLLLIHPSIPANSVKELIQLAKAKPERFSYSTSGSGSFNHMSAELFNLMAGTKMVHIPYKSGGQALTSVVSGEADLVFQTMPAAIPFVEARRLKALAVCTLERHPLFPKLPTASESGLPGLRHQHLVRHPRAGCDTERDRGETQRSARHDREKSRDEQAPARSRRRSGHQYARAVRGAGSLGYNEVGESRQSRVHQGELGTPHGKEEQLKKNRARA